MRILLIGATGAAGSRIRTEARRRGHEVIATSRRGGGGVRALEASDPEQVAAAAREVEVIIGATRPAVGSEGEVEGIARVLGAVAARTGTRLLVVGGAAPLWVPGTGHRALDDPRWVPPGIRPIAAASMAQLGALREAAGEAPWTYLAPAADFRPGEDRGTYRRSVGDRHGAELVISAEGASRIAMEDYAVAACEEIAWEPVARGVVAVGW